MKNFVEIDLFDEIGKKYTVTIEGEIDQDNRGAFFIAEYIHLKDIVLSVDNFNDDYINDITAQCKEKLQLRDYS